MFKKRLGIVCAAVMVAGAATALCSCGSGGFDGILIWGPEEHSGVYTAAIEAYKKDHPDFKTEVRFAALGDAGANGNVEKDVESAGSIITFPNDQLISLKRMGALSKLTEDSANWIKQNNVVASCEAGKIGEGYYAYPISADNGFVLLFNKDAFKDTAVWDAEKQTFKEGYTFRDLYAALDERGAQPGHEKWANGKVIWPEGSAWYESGAFFATGGDYSVEYDEKGVQLKATCNFGYNTLPDGTKDFSHGLDTVRAIMNTMTNEDGTINKHFAYTDDTDPAYNDYVSDHVGNGSKAAEEPLAGVVSWNNSVPRDAWGEDYDCAILPTLVAESKLLGGEGTRYTWRSFSGFKLIGVNPFSAFARKNADNIVILHELARYLSGKDVSLMRYAASKLGPSNLEAQKDPEVQTDKFLNALNKQYSLVDDKGNPIGFRVQDSTPANFWTPIANFGKGIYQACAEGKTGAFNNIKNTERQLAQLQYDIEASAD